MSGPEKYKVIDSHFHTFTTERSRICATLSYGGQTNHGPHHNLTSSYNHHVEQSYGLSFAHDKVAERFYKAVIQLIPKQSSSTSYYRGLSHSLSMTTSLTIMPEEMIDFPPLVQSDSFISHQSFLEEEAGALTSSGKFPNPLEESAEDEQSLKVLQQSFATNDCRHVGGIVEDVDLVDKRKSMLSNQPIVKKYHTFLQNKRRGSLDHSSESLISKHSPLMKQRSESLEDVRISYPTTVRHLAHISHATPFHTLKQVINTGIAPGSVLESDIEKQRYEKLKRTPSAPCRVRHKSFSFVSSTPACPTIHITHPVIANKKQQHPKPPPQITNFDALVQKLQATGEMDRQSEFTSSTEAWQQSFHCAVSNLIRKKIYDDPSNPKLLSFTQSGREETSERPSSRTASLIIHDHGIVCL